MALHDKIAELREYRMRNGGDAVPDAYQGVTKDKIRRVLSRIALENADLVDGVFALLDDETPSWFPKPPSGAKFCDGATTAHIACHMGILQRGYGKLDREGRDYWIKPLRELGGIEPITLVNGVFLDGHVIHNSGNTCYRLNGGLRSILTAPDEEWPERLAAWASEDEARARHEFQAQAAEASKLLVNTGHGDLIKASIDVYAKRFLPGYRVVFTDEGAGDRISSEHRALLNEAGIDLRRGDGMPDVLLWNPETDHLWVIEAVTSDGEADLHKVTQLNLLAERSGKNGVGFTTTYRTWKEAAKRQDAHRNIAVGTYIWIQGDPAKHLLVQSFN